ncbi:helix-turn-helix domain-containing protein [Myroides sp. LJL116]
MSYKEKLGQALKAKREELGYTLKDIVYMSGVSRSSVIKVEKGSASKFDSYIEYAKSVQYPFQTLIELNIPMIPIRVLGEERKRKVLITKHLFELIKEGFFKKEKTTAEVRTYLLEENKINKEVTSSTLSSVLGSLTEDGTLISRKEGNKNYYSL